MGFPMAPRPMKPSFSKPCVDAIVSATVLILEAECLESFPDYQKQLIRNQTREVRHTRRAAACCVG